MSVAYPKYCFAQATRLRKVSRKTNRLDAEYLFYVPFCEVFVSGDKLHEQLAPMVLGAGRTFFPIRVFKAEMARHVAERAAKKAAAPPFGER